MKVSISKATREFFESTDEETLEIMLRMNERYNLYDGKSFTWYYDEEDKQFYVMNYTGEELMAGIKTTYPFKEVTFDFIVSEDGDYFCVSDFEFND